MPLPKQTIGIVFADGVDTKTDAKVTAKPIDVENFRFDKPGALRKRLGHTSASVVSDGTTVADPQSLATRGDELVLVAKSAIHGSTSAGAWKNRGRFTPTKQTSRFQAWGTYSDVNVTGWDYAYDPDNDNEFFVYTGTGVDANYTGIEGCWRSIYNDGQRSSESFQYSGGSFDTYQDIKFALRRGTTRAAGSYNAVTYNATDGNLYRFTGSALTSLVSSPGSGKFTCLATNDGSRIFVIWYTGTAIQLREFNSSWSFVANASAITTTVSGKNIAAAISGDESTLYICWENATDIQCAPITLSNLAVGSTITSIDTANTESIFGVCDEDNDTVCCFFYDDLDTSTADGKISQLRMFEIDDNLSPSGWPVKDNAKLGCCPVFRGEGAGAKYAFWYYYMPNYFSQASGTQYGTAIAAEVTNSVDGAGYAEFSLLGAYAQNSSFAAVLAASDGPQVYPGHALAISANDVRCPVWKYDSLNAPIQVHVVRLDFTHRSAALEAADSLYLTSGVLHQYDGLNVFEAGFLIKPDPPKITLSSGVGTLEAAKYQYRVTYLYTDAQGRTHESAPSDPVEADNTAGTYDTATIYYAQHIPTLKAATQLRVRVWRSIKNPPAPVSFYLIKEVLPVITYTADLNTYSGTTLKAQEVLYTVGNEVSNLTPAAIHCIASRGNRVYLGSERGNVYYSKETIDGVGVEWSPVFAKRADPAGGEIAQIATLDQTTVVFKQGNSVQVFSGAGPSVTGANNQFSPMREISSDITCEEGAPTATSDLGLWFFSKKGIALLSRALQVDPTVGYPVDSSKGQTLTSCVTYPAKDEIRFGFSDGETAVFHTVAKQWAFWPSTAHAGQAAMFGDAYQFITTGAKRFKESSGFVDDTTDINFAVETPWIKPSQILMGYQRIYWVGILGTYSSAHTLTVKVYYDYIDTVAETVSIPSADIRANESSYVARFKPARQKCRAVKFRISDTSLAGTQESAELNGIVLEVGVKGGVSRLRTEQTV